MYGSLIPGIEYCYVLLSVSFFPPTPLGLLHSWRLIGVGVDHKASSRTSFLNPGPNGIKRRKLIRDQRIQGYFTSTQMVVGEEAGVWLIRATSEPREHKQGRGSAGLLIPLSSGLRSHRSSGAANTTDWIIRRHCCQM